MAQTLKEDTRNAIIEAAKNEFLRKGYENASMRDIARNANMTVGNLYRYFRNKEDINEFIVSDTYNQLINLYNMTYDKVSSADDVSDKLDDMADRLVDIYTHNQTGFNILMKDQVLSNKLISWFTKMIYDLTKMHYEIDDQIGELKLLSKAYAMSIIAGIRELFVSNALEKERLSLIVRTYLNSYLSLMNNDIRKLVN